MKNILIQYYNDLDVNLNKGLEEMTPVVDILDDFVSEAKEVRGANPWLVYSYSIHKRRMAGTDHMVYDMMDEEFELILCKYIDKTHIEKE